MKTISLPEGKYCGYLDKVLELDFAWLSLTSYGPEDKYAKHYHENPYLSLLGSGSYTETNRSGTDILNNGEIIFRPAFYDHANGFRGEPGFCFNIEFKKDWLKHADRQLTLPSETIIYDCGSFPSVFKAFSEFVAGNDSSAMADHLWQWLFEINADKLPESNLPWISDVKKILESELEFHHTLESISSRVHVHPVYLAGCFKKKTGTTIGEYQATAKLRRAAWLLLNTKKTIGDIAIETGFYDSAHFIRKHIAMYGISPARLRQNLKS